MITTRLQARIRTVVPAPASWASFTGAFFNLVMFGLAALGGEWVVHQAEYLIVYGSQFSAVMATSPHRLYMATAGLLLAALGLALLILLAVFLVHAAARQHALLSLLPGRVRRMAPIYTRAAVAGEVRPRTGLVIARTALVLAAIQIAMYIVQENIEFYAWTGSWQGLAVVLAPQHITAIPLHLLAATLIALSLWTFTRWINRSRTAVRFAEALVKLLVAPERPPRSFSPIRGRLPGTTFHGAGLGSRAPPLAA